MLAVVTVTNPPVNALGAAVRQGLEAGIREGLADDAIRAALATHKQFAPFAHVKGEDLFGYYMPTQEVKIGAYTLFVRAVTRACASLCEGSSLSVSVKHWTASSTKPCGDSTSPRSKCNAATPACRVRA